VIEAFDHVAIPIDQVDAMLEFYTELGCTITSVHGGLVHAVQFGENKINFHTPQVWRSEQFSLRAHDARPGCGDFCFVWANSRQSLMEQLDNLNAPIEEGPIERTGGRECGTAVGISVYTRDPDANLLEFITYE
jgi:catechol 2,3-dioxygenase-like lactoylglutathione lyase family enzyme